MLRAEIESYHYPESDEAALRGVAFELRAGARLLVAGASGAGKTTLGYLLAGFAPHFFHGALVGDVWLAGRSMQRATLGQWVRDVALLLENPFNQISGARATVFEEIAFGLENLGVPRRNIGARVQATLAALGIAGLAHRAPHSLSGGQMQRVALAALLVLEPRLLLLDEPTAQLDPQGTREIFALLEGLAARGSTLVLATHKLGEAAPLATEALLLHRGEMVRGGAARPLLTDAGLAGWGIAPPPFVALARRIGLPAPWPLTLDEAVGALAAHTSVAPPRPAPAPAILTPTFDLPPTPVRLDTLALRYPSGVAALRGVSLHLEPGTISALVGENGAGKSTLARTLNGLLRPDSGRVRVGGWEVGSRPTHEMAQRVGFLFQNPDEQLFAPTVAAEVAFGPRNLGWPPAQVGGAVAEALEATGLAALRDAHPYELSYALRRWVALASVLAMRTPLLVLDEPTTGQDLAGMVRLAALLRGWRAAGGTVLLISHDLQFVAAVADEVAVMAGGTVLAHGPPAALLTDEPLLRRAGLAVPPLAALAQRLALPPTTLTEAALVAALYPS